MMMSADDTRYGSPRILTHDHEDLDTLLAEYVAACQGDPDDARARWHAFSATLRAPAEMEERVLFPAYEANVRPAEGGPLAALRHQHRMILALLDALDRGLWTGPVRSARVNELMGLLWAHEAREEALFLPWMRACLNDDERRDLHERMKAAPAPDFTADDEA